MEPGRGPVSAGPNERGGRYSSDLFYRHRLATIVTGATVPGPIVRYRLDHHAQRYSPAAFLCRRFGGTYPGDPWILRCNGPEVSDQPSPRPPMGNAARRCGPHRRINPVDHSSDLTLPPRDVRRKQIMRGPDILPHRPRRSC
jgi:hypothetical protein